MNKALKKNHSIHSFFSLFNIYNPPKSKKRVVNKMFKVLWFLKIASSLRLMHWMLLLVWGPELTNILEIFKNDSLQTNTSLLSPMLASMHPVLSPLIPDPSLAHVSVH